MRTPLASTNCSWIGYTAGVAGRSAAHAPPAAAVRHTTTKIETNHNRAFIGSPPRCVFSLWTGTPVPTISMIPVRRAWAPHLEDMEGAARRGGSAQGTVRGLVTGSPLKHAGYMPRKVSRSAPTARSMWLDSIAYAGSHVVR